jgi:hypothetical protein
MKKIVPFVMISLFGIGLLSSCSKNPSSSATPCLSKGNIVSVDLLDRPYPQYSPSEVSWSTLKEGTVEIYDNFIIVTYGDGLLRLAPHNCYMNLIYKLK